jgi:putative CocE/NonD family hydrolase
VEQDRKLLAYTSDPLAAGIVVAGSPLAKFTLATMATDGEVIVYLEHVAPNGAVTYLTEGALRLAHRKLSAEANAVFSSDPLHTYLAADVRPMAPGQPAAIEIALSPVAVVFRRGDRIRVAIAGADADNLARIPAAGSVTLTLARGPDGSFVELPVLGHK